jgi:hypothetical protein
MRKNLNVSESEERPEMNYSMLDEAMEQVQVPVEIDAMSIYRAMEHIQDGRHKRGVRYSVALIFTLILLAKVAGMTTPLAIAQWVRRLSGMAQASAATHAQELSLCGDLHERAASSGC